MIYLIIGIIASRNVKTVNDYLFAGRKLNFFQATFGLIATQLGGGMLLGTSQKAFEIGLWGVLYTLGMSLGFLLLGLGIASKLQELNIDTVAELFERSYKSKQLRKIASILSIMTLCGILIAQIIASKTLLYSITGQNEFLFLLFWLFVIAYTIIGGLSAVAIIDSIQVLFIIAIFVSLFCYALITEPISFSNLMVVQRKLTLEHDISYYVPIFLVPALFSIIEQDLAQKFFSAKSKGVAIASSLVASLFMLVFSCIPIYFGMYANYMQLNVPANTSPLMVAVDRLTNNVFFALVICAIIAAITSTADSLMCAISSNISQDFSLNFLTLKNKLTRSKIITLASGAIALSTSYFVKPDIINILIQSYEISVSCLLVPLLVAMYTKNVNKESAIGAIIFGLIGFIGFKLYPVNYEIIYTLLLSMSGFLIMSFKKN